MKKICLAAAGALALGACSHGPDGQVGAVQAPAKWNLGYSAASEKVMARTFGTTRLKAGDYVWAKGKPPEGPTAVVVSLSDQMAYVYRAGQLIGASSVSSGKQGKETPPGMFPILEKRKVHASNRYENVPMPYMQRLDWYGIALHGGTVPGYPASHGCVRLPMKFAQRLFDLTEVGSQVLIEQ